MSYIYFVMTDDTLIQKKIKLNQQYTLKSENIVDWNLFASYSACVNYIHKNNLDKMNVCKAYIKPSQLVQGLNAAMVGDVYTEVPVKIIEIIRIAKIDSIYLVSLKDNKMQIDQLPNQ